MHKNQHDTSTYENSSYGNAGYPDFLDTIDDYNNGGTYPSQGPSTTFWTNEKSTGENWYMNVAADNGSGGGVAGDGLCNGSEGCVFSDRITGILWSNDRGVMTWANALAHCNVLNYGGFPSSWRVPTQKELMQGYINGVWALKGTDKLSLSNDYYWSSTTRSDNTATAWMGYLSNGFMVGGTKTDSFRTICVRQ